MWLLPARRLASAAGRSGLRCWWACAAGRRTRQKRRTRQEQAWQVRSALNDDRVRGRPCEGNPDTTNQSSPKPEPTSTGLTSFLDFLPAAGSRIGPAPAPVRREQRQSLSHCVADKARQEGGESGLPPAPVRKVEKTSARPIERGKKGRECRHRHDLRRWHHLRVILHLPHDHPRRRHPSRCCHCCLHWRRHDYCLDHDFLTCSSCFPPAFKSDRYAGSTGRAALRKHQGGGRFRQLPSMLARCISVVKKAARRQHR